MKSASHDKYPQSRGSSFRYSAHSFLSIVVARSSRVLLCTSTTFAVEVGEANNATMARALANSMSAQLAPYLATAGVDVCRQLQCIGGKQELASLVAAHLRGRSIVKLKLMTLAAGRCIDVTNRSATTRAPTRVPVANAGNVKRDLNQSRAVHAVAARGGMPTSVDVRAIRLAARARFGGARGDDNVTKRALRLSTAVAGVGATLGVVD